MNTPTRTHLQIVRVLRETSTVKLEPLTCKVLAMELYDKVSVFELNNDLLDALMKASRWLGPKTPPHILGEVTRVIARGLKEPEPFTFTAHDNVSG